MTTAMSFADVMRVTGARAVSGPRDASPALTGVSTDTRSLRAGELYLALSGPAFDGNAFARTAADAGAGALLLRDDPALDLSGLPKGLPVATCRDPLRALADVAGWHRRRLALPVVAITGSVGKTSTKNILLELLRDVRVAVGSPASFNNEVGVPLTLLLADERTDVLIAEIGTNAPGEIAALCRIAQPSAGIVTEVGASHLLGLHNIEGVAVEKSALPACLPSSGFCVLNADNPLTAKMAQVTAARPITFSVRDDADPHIDFRASSITFDASGTRFTLKGARVPEPLSIHVPLLGEPAVKNVLAALAACDGLGVDLELVYPALARLVPAPRRMQPVLVDGLTLLDDSYNANPDSVRAGLGVLRGLRAHARRVMVLGEMLELGPDAGILHHRVGREAADANVDLLVLVGDLTRATAAGALEAGLGMGRLVHFDTVEDAITVLPGMLRDGDAVWIKGSRGSRLDRLVDHLAPTSTTHGTR
tara:strand:+ start:30983 stop:32419 length:1437 start_codon:yes stop_codon:yes gene_type:complete